MKKRFLLLCLLPAFAVAQEDAPPIQMPSNLFFDTDFTFTPPKHTLSIGPRSLSGAKASFMGAGNLESTQLFGDFATKGLSRGYHDGAINQDGRVRPVDDGAGNVTNVPVTPDGKTNNWQMLESSQVTPTGDITMSAYKAAVIDSGPKTRNPRETYGLELAIRRDMASFARVRWNLLGGISVNGLSAKTSAVEDATVTRLTDTYSLDGTPAPVAPYPGSPISSPVVDVNGFPVLDAEGNQATTFVDTVVNIVQDPVSRETTTEVKEGAVINNFNLRGAYFTLRAGPSVEIPLGRFLQATVSAGAAVVYAGTSYTVQQNFDPETGPVITDTVTSSKNSILPGYYADASIDLLLTERAGFYLGMVYQSTGDFNQTVDSATANYSTKVNLKSMQGLRMGMNVRF